MIAIPASEIADVLAKEIANGDAYTREGDVFCCGQDVITESGWKIEFFIDCGEVDYVDNATAPDGRRGEYADWGDGNPVTLLDEAAYELLHVKLIDTPISQ
mgnify:CR=1 FL=1